MRMLVRLPNWIGDAVMAYPAIDMLVKAFPGASIMVAAPPGICEIFAHCQDLILIPLKSRGAKGVLEAARIYRGHQIDRAVLLQNAFGAACAAVLGGIPKRLGLATDGRRYLLTDSITAVQRSKMHEQDIFMVVARETVNRWGGDIRAIEDVEPYPRLNVLYEDYERIKDKFGIRVGEEDYAVLHPGAAYGTAKRWPQDRFASLGRLIRGEMGWRVVIIGSGVERDVCTAVASAIGKAGVMDVSGQTTVRDVMAIQSGARFVVANDSGSAHMAAALGVPTVVVFGSTNPLRTAPRNPNCTVIQRLTDCSPCKHRHCPKDHRCMTSVRVEDIWMVVKSVVNHLGEFNFSCLRKYEDTNRKA